VPPSQRNIGRAVILLAIIACGLGLRTWIYVHIPYDSKVCAADFAGFFVGGKLIGTPQLYSAEAAFEAERQFMGCSHRNEVFVKLPFYSLVVWPFAQLPFLTAIAIWRTLGLIALGVFIWLWPGDRLAAVAACAWALPVAASFTAAQDVAFLLLGAMVAYRLLEQDRQLLAGIVLAVFAAKFHLFILLVPVFLIQRKLWRTMLGAAYAGGVLVALSFLAGGWSWIPRYWQALHQPRLDPFTYNLMNLTGVFGYGSPFTLPAAALIAVLCWYLMRRGTLAIGFAATLAGGVLIASHTTVADGVLFLPVLLMAREWGRSHAMRLLATTALTPLYAFLPTGSLQAMVVALLAASAWVLYLDGSRRTAPPPAEEPEPSAGGTDSSLSPQPVSPHPVA
jgi:hypothetical protein